MFARQPLSALFALTVLAACGAPDEPTVADGGLRAAKPGGGTTGPSYGVVEVVVGSPFASAEARAVDDGGAIVGTAWTADTRLQRGWFKTSASSATRLLRYDGDVEPTGITGNQGFGMRTDASNGLTFVIGGTEPAVSSGDVGTQGALWTVSAGTVGLPRMLPFWPRDVNTAGTVVGDMRVLRLDGTDITIPAPGTAPADPAAYGLAGINASEDVLYNEDVTAGRAHARIGGDWIPLEPPAGMEGYQTVATAMSDRATIGGTQTVFVSGKLQLGPTECYPMRWTVNVATRTVVNVERRMENGTALAVSSTGDASGVYGRGGAGSPFAWTRSGAFVKLPVPKGMSNGKAAAISPSGRFITGFAEKSLSPRALLWTLR